MRPANEATIRAAISQAGAPALFHAGLVRLVDTVIEDERQPPKFVPPESFGAPMRSVVGFRAGEQVS